MEINHSYIKKIKNRSFLRFIIGAVFRLKNYGFNAIVIYFAKIKGASIGRNSYITLKLALRANGNLIVGENSLIGTHDIDLRQKVIIGSNVIINKGSTIIRQSHNINSTEFETTGRDLVIEDYVWLTTNTLVVPSCKIIRAGTVIAAGAVVVKDTNKGEVLVGNPATFLRKRTVLATDLFLPALQGRDLVRYWNARFSKL